MTGTGKIGVDRIGTEDFWNVLKNLVGGSLVDTEDIVQVL